MVSGNEVAHPVEARACGPYRLWLRYSDGAEGEVDLSHLEGKGVFAAWADQAFFSEVRIDFRGAVCWGEGDEIIDLCPDGLHARLTEGAGA